MPSKEFCALIDSICQQARIPNPKSLYERTDLEVDKVKFTLMDASTGDASRINVYTDFGALPHGEMQAKVMHRLLHLNLGCFEQNLPFFAIDGGSNHVFLVANIPFKPDSAALILDALAKLAVHAKEWQDNYLMPDKNETSAFSADRSGNGPSPQARLMKRAAAAYSGLFKA